ncbi:MAG: peptidase dipeptidase [Ignavibacteria bacterium]|nr:peptidase dipeptidase [Ignavibacteria bacterium]
MKRLSFIKLFLILAILMLNIDYSYSCTNFLVSKGASVDGSVIITYNADAGGFMEPLYFRPPEDHKDGDSVDIYEWDSGRFLGKIAQVTHTYGVVGLMNEYQVSLGETTFGGRGELRDTAGKIDYGSLMFLGLQRAKTAREAIKVMTDLVAQYGYYSSGESFSVSDANEAWIMEMIGKGPGNKGAIWAARRVPDGYVCAHANQARIREVPLDDPENCLYASDIISFAEKKGFYDPNKGDFSFVDAYCPLNPGELLFCEGRVWSLFRRAAPSLNLSTDYWRAVKGAEPYPLFIKPDKKLSVQDVISLMRDHFEGTEFDMTKDLAAGPFGCPYRWKNLTWKLEGDTITEYGWERPISTQQTGFCFVSQSRGFLPREIGGVHWFGFDDNYSNIYVPLYCSMTRVPKSYQHGPMAEFDFGSAFWIYNLVANIAYTKYSYIIKDIQAVQKEIEGKFRDYQPAIELAAMELYKKDSKLAVSYLTDYSNNQADITMERWFELWKQLVVKYNDGYINNVNKNRGRSPEGKGYGDKFLRMLTKERPGYYNVDWKK